MSVIEYEPPSTPPRLEIEGPNGISLKQLFVEDAQSYFELLEYNRDYFRQEHLGGTDDLAEKYPDVESLIHSITNPVNPDRIRLGIWNNGTLVGSINLTPAENNTAEIGYWVGKQYSCQGFATEAVKLLSQYAIAKPEFNSLFAKVLLGNDASKKTLLKNGFTWEKLVKEEDPETGKIKMYNQLKLAPSVTNNT